jgi:hypothetical protein
MDCRAWKLNSRILRGLHPGSTNWLSSDAELMSSSDLDIMVIVENQSQAARRAKFLYHSALLEVSYLARDKFQSANHILGDYHLAPSFRATKILVDPRGHLAPLLAAVSRDYAKQTWVRRRCAHARDKVLAHIRSINEHTLFTIR